jgi:glycosyltransferase involved in cell wall biosynthesis
MGRLLFLTTANLPSNPRLVKEVDLLQKDNHIVVICFKLGNWSDVINGQMVLERKQLQFIELDATQGSFISWAIGALLEKTSRILWPFFKSSIFLTTLAHSRRSLMLIKEAKKIKLKPEKIIAHNLGALFPAFHLAQRWKIPFHYDIEDFDPGIIVPEVGIEYKHYSETLLKKCLPFAESLTSASPLIGKFTLDLIGGHQNHTLILNSFPSNEFRSPNKPKNDILKLVWFSQRISFGRGLEQLFEACITLQNRAENKIGFKNKISITLIGELDFNFERQIIRPATKQLDSVSINVLPALKQKELHFSLADYNIGLALEVGKDLNNNLAISNKIMAYAQAGLYILATNTQAQAQFIKDEPIRGMLCGQTAEDISLAIESLIAYEQNVKLEASLRYLNGRNIAWEKECQKINKIYRL